MVCNTIGIPYPRSRFPETSRPAVEAAEKIMALLERGHSWGYIGELHTELLWALFHLAESESTKALTKST